MSETSERELQIHPAAELLPLLNESALRELAADIRANGLRVPIVVWDERDVVIDGRNRLAACRVANVTPSFERRSFADDEEAARFVVSMNVPRRHLTESQRSIVGDRLSRQFFEPAARKRQAHGETAPGKTLSANVREASRKASEDAAAAVNVSPRTIEHAKVVVDSGSPALIAAVVDGKIAVSAAASIAKRPANEQDAIIGRVESGEANNVPQAVRQFEEQKRVEASAASTIVPTATLLVGDARAYLEAFAGAHCIITDPPYGIETHRTRVGGHDYADGEGYAGALLDEVLAGLEPVLAPDAHLYVFSGYTNAHAFKQIIAKHFQVQDNPIIWVKGSHTMCDFSQWYPSKHEYIWFARKRGTKRGLAACVPDVIECKLQRATTHSAEKPVELLSKLIEQSTIRGEIVVDPFSGSGATGAAALAAERRFVGAELDPKWAAVARSRLTNAA